MVVIPRIDYLKDCLSKQGLEVATCDNSTLCTLNEATKLVSTTLMQVYVSISLIVYVYFVKYRSLGKIHC